MVPLPPSVMRFIDIYSTQNALYDTFKFIVKVGKTVLKCETCWWYRQRFFSSCQRGLFCCWCRRSLMPVNTLKEYCQDYNIDSKLDCGRTSQFRARAEAIVHFREVEKSRTKRAEERGAQQVESDSPRGVDCAHGGRPHKYRLDTVQGGGHLHGQGKAERLGSLLLLWLKSQDVYLHSWGATITTLFNHFVV